MKRIALACLLVAASTLFILGCTGKEGPTGPAGATGPTGPTGNANVKIKLFNISPSEWNITSDSSGYYANHIIGEISSAIYDSGTVLVYTKVIYLNYAWVELPYTVPESSRSFSYLFSYYVNTVRLDIKYSDGWLNKPTTTQAYKVIIIDSPHAANVLQNIHVNDYNEVKHALHLTD
jgi:hypothetical protein